VVGSNTLIKTVARYVVLTLLTVIMIFPILWMFRVALISIGGGTGLENPLSGNVTLDNFTDLLSGGFLTRPLINSAIVVTLVTIGNCFFCFMVGYSAARYRFWETKMLFVMALGVLMIPVHITIIPIYLLSLKMGIFDSYFALVLPFLVQPLGIFLIKQYVESVPVSMEEAARIDGASELSIVFRVVMPVCKPALAVLAIQIFFTNWNSFLFPFILTSRTELNTLPVALEMLHGQQAIDWPHLMAGSALAVIPVLLIFVILQRQIVSGITAGAVKQ